MNMAFNLFHISCLILLVIVATTKVTSKCTDKVETSYNASIKWQCSREQPQKVYCEGLDDVFLMVTTNITSPCIKPNITVRLHSQYGTLGINTTFTLKDGYFRLFGLDNNGTVIHCSEKVAIKFNVSHGEVEIHHLSLKHCSDGIRVISFSGYYKALTLYKLKIMNFIGLGAVFENISGSVIVNETTFTNGRHHNKTGISSASVRVSFMSDYTHLEFNNCQFSEYKGLKRSRVGGSGLIAEFLGNTTNSVVTITSSHFINNTGEEGAGLHIVFADNATNNSLNVRDTLFHNNSNVESGVDVDNVGGGAYIKTQDSSNSNKIKFTNCSFTNNRATWGGGLAVHAKPGILQSQANQNNLYLISNCTFFKNLGSVGSAISIYCTPLPMRPQLCNAIPYFEGYSYFTQNGNRIANINVLTTTESTLHVSAFPSYIKGATLQFEGNRGSALYVRNSVLALTEQTELRFYHNSAATGAGIALYDSWISISRGCNLSFINNTASAYGGAIYALQSADLYVPHIDSCFIRPNDSGANSSDTGCNFYFAGNTATNKPNSIYTTSIIPCVDDLNDIKDTFCGWSNWTFTNVKNCRNEIETSVTSLNRTPSRVRVFPGVPNSFVVGIDDLGHKVQNPLDVVLTPLSSKSSKVIHLNYTEKGVIVYANRSTTHTVLIQLNNARRVRKKVDIIVKDCPPGFGFISEEHACRCLENRRNILQCSGQNSSVSILNGFCMSLRSIHGVKESVYGRCVFSSASNTGYIDLPENEEDLDSHFCGKFNRKGLLCGQCKDGASIDVFSPMFSCHFNCHSSAKSWAIYLAVNGIPPLLLFLIIFTFHVKFTAASMNGFIFFSQVITLSQEALVIAAIAQLNVNSVQNNYLYTILNVYNLWSLGNDRIFYTLSNQYPVCLGEHLRVIDVLALHYVTAVYPFLLIVVAYVVIELHARNCRLLVWLWKPLCFLCSRLRRSWRLQTSVVDAFASFVILSYVKLVRISLILLTYTVVLKTYENHTKTVLHVNNYDPTIVYLSLQHMPFIFLGLLVSIIFTILPALLLLFYQCKSVQRCLNRCKVNRVELKTFVEVFQGCYKDGRNGGPDRRFFAGLYLIFRVLIFLTFNLEIQHVSVYFILVVVCIAIVSLISWFQPYKVNFYNHLDTCFVALLAILFGLHILGFVNLETLLTLPQWIVKCGLVVLSLPLVYIVGLFIRNVFRRLRYFKCIAWLLKLKIQLLSKDQLNVSIRKYYSSIPHVTHTEVCVDSIAVTGDSSSEDGDRLSSLIPVDSANFEKDD